MAAAGFRAKAKEQGLTHYFTGNPCRHGHIDWRFTGDGICMACAREKSSRHGKTEAGRAAHARRQLARYYRNHAGSLIRRRAEYRASVAV